MTQNDAILVAALIGSGPAWVNLYVSMRGRRRQTGELKDHIDLRLSAAPDGRGDERAP